MLLIHLMQALVFYLIFSSFAAIGLPLTTRVFAGKLTAYAAAKIAGLVVFGYAIWLLSLIRILNYQNYPLLIGLFLLFAAAGLYYSRTFFNNEPQSKPKKSGTTTPVWRKIIWLETIIVSSYFLYLLIRSHFPEINGTERFMDLALLSAAGKTEHFPFIDPWYAGKTINYYYHGSYLMSLISNLAKLPYALTYNFSIGLIFSQTLLLTAALGTNLSKSKLAGLLAAFMTAMAGTLFYAGCVLNGIFKIPQTICSYASSTRLYTPSYIINEIPSYSFTVGDLHAHFLALPFFIFNLILIWAFTKQEKISKSLGLLLSVGIATSGMINAWDAVTLICLLLVAGTIKFYFKIGTKFWLSPLIVLGAIAMVIPNLLTFKSPVLGLGFTPSYVRLYELTNVQWPTPLMAILGMWGALVVGILIAFWVKRQNIKQYPFHLALLILSIGILVGVELFFIKDIYSVSNAPYFRANTTFKFGYHAWVMLSILFAGIVFPIAREKSNQRYSLSSKLNSLIILIMVLGGLFYPYQAVKQFYFTEQPNKELSLNGSDWIDRTMPSDGKAIDYINHNINHRTVIAEAVGDSYSTHARIATYTGMIAPMGWTTHEWTWRLDAEAAKAATPGKQVETGWGEIAKIMGQIEALYTTDSATNALDIINQYGIEYVYVGDLERKSYPNLQVDKFNSIGLPVFTDSNTVLYKINQ